MSPFKGSCALALLLALGACGKKDKQSEELAALDAQLTGNAVDPAIKSALADQIVVDPQLVGQSNRNAVRPADKPADGALPIVTGDAKKDAADAVRLAGGRLISAPAPAQGAETGGGVTLGGLARQQTALNGGTAECSKKLAYANSWAQRLPTPFTLYPGAQLMEAAGADKDGCTLRAASFVTPVPKQQVIDFYFTQARRAGFDAEHRVIGGDNVLGGTRKGDGNAYFIVFTNAPGGKTGVDIIADGGR